VVGKGPRIKYLKELTDHLGIEKNVTFTGPIFWPALYPFLSNVPDICVSSSISENFPFYILECMAAKKPIIATNVGGVSEAVIDGENGYLVPPKNPSLMADAILELIIHPDKAKQMGIEGRKLVEQRFSMDAITHKLTKVYESATRRTIT
jgi:glycosyltransferase involved in cell wall biosynthesis